MNYNEIFEGLDNVPYDFIAKNYWKLSKEELRDIILELLVLDEQDYIYKLAKKQLSLNLLINRDWEEKK